LIEQQAMIVEARDQSVLVRIGGQTGCAACDEGKGCGAGLFGKLLKRKPLELVLSNTSNAQAGQPVQLGLSESLFMKLVFRLYGWPLVAGFLGAVIAYRLADLAGAGPGMLDLATAAGAVGGALLILIFWNRASKPDIGPDDIHMLAKQVATATCSKGISSNRTRTRV